jgi:peroxiredoxin
MILRQQSVCLNIGEEAPDFELPDQDGKNIRLSDYRGNHNVILVLNPGRLNESCKDFILYYKEYLADFNALETQVLGINMDSISANEEWTSKIGGLGFPLLSDHSPLGKTTFEYDCFVPNEGYGKRALFVIDKKGIISHIQTLSGESGTCPDLQQIIASLQMNTKGNI